MSHDAIDFSKDLRGTEVIPRRGTLYATRCGRRRARFSFRRERDKSTKQRK